MATEDMWEESRTEKQKHWLYLGKAFFVDMIHHDNFIVKRSTSPSGAGRGGKKNKSEKISFKSFKITNCGTRFQKDEGTWEWRVGRVYKLNGCKAKP